MRVTRVGADPSATGSGGITTRRRGRAYVVVIAVLLLAAGCEVTRLPDSAAEPDETGPGVAPPEGGDNGPGPGNGSGSERPNDGRDPPRDGDDPTTDGDDGSSQPSPFTFSLPSGPSGPVDVHHRMYLAMLSDGCDGAERALNELAASDDAPDLTDIYELLWRAAIAACRGDESETRRLFEPVRSADFGDEDRDACVVLAAIVSALDRIPIDISNCPPPATFGQEPGATDPSVATSSPDADEGLRTDVTPTSEPGGLDE